MCNFVEFDEVYDDVEQLNEKNIPSYFYTLPKVVACEKMREPFVLLENDFYLWDIPDDSVFMDAELIIEDFVDTPSSFFTEIDYMKKNDMVTRPRWYRFAKDKKMKMPLKGIYGGNNFKYINDHANEVLKLIQNEDNLKHFNSKDANKILLNTHRVYDNWYLGAKFDFNKKETFSVRNSNIKYTHLYSNKKTEPETMLKLYKKAEKDLPQFMSVIKKSKNLVYNPTPSFNHFIKKLYLILKILNVVKRSYPSLWH